MEWVEVTGKTVAEAKDKALDRLGIDEADAEFEVVDEPITGLFGRLKREAKVRARVRPAMPRGRARERERRRPKRDGRRDAGGSGGARPERAAPSAPAGRKPATAETPRPTAGRDRIPRNNEGATVSLENQAEIATSFMKGLTEAFGLSAQVNWTTTSEDHAEVNVEGDELGLLIGPKGRTLAALNEISRAVVLRQLDSAPEGRVHIDVAGYRQRRREALERFARSVAEQVVTSGVRRVLEPMSAPDRKIVHDAVGEIVGVRTSSEGEEPARRVVISPAD